MWLPGSDPAAPRSPFVIRPVLVGLCLVPARLGRNERGFVLFAGLKGAVPILLGSFLLAAGVADAQRLYGIVVVVVVFSVVVQGSLVPTVARLLRLPMRPVEPEPWALGVRLRDEPDGVHRLTVTAGSPADGRTDRRARRPARRRMGQLHRARRPARARQGRHQAPARATRSWSWPTRTCTTS